jgi:hypothetical protein
MAWIFEQPLTLVGLGVLGVVACVIAWYQSGRAEAAYAALLLLPVTAGLVAWSYLVETEHESLRHMLFQSARLLENNQLEEAESGIYDRPSEAVLAARDLLRAKACRFEAVRIKKIHTMELSGPDLGRRAEVSMNAFIEANLQGQQIKLPIYIEAVLYRVDGQWKLFDLSYDRPNRGWR